MTDINSRFILDALKEIEEFGTRVNLSYNSNLDNGHKLRIGDTEQIVKIDVVLPALKAYLLGFQDGVKRLSNSFDKLDQEIEKDIS